MVQLLNLQTDTFTKVQLQQNFNCHTKNVVYMLQCKKCRQQYIGQTKKTLGDRFANHRGYVNNKNLDKATGAHFNLPGHSVSDMTISVIEKVRRTDGNYREERESMHIRDFRAKHSGLNRKK